MIETKDSTWVLLEKCVPNMLDSDCTGAMGLGVGGVGGRLRSNQDSARACTKRGE